MKKLPYIIESHILRQFARFEITFDEMIGDHEDCIYDSYRFCLDDFKAALTNLKNSNATYKTMLEEWYLPLFYKLEDELRLNQARRVDDKLFLTYETDEEMIYMLFEWCLEQQEWYTSNWNVNYTPDYNACLNTIKTYERNKKLDPSERKLTKLMKVGIINRIGLPINLKEATEEERAFYKKCVESLCTSNSPQALRIKAYSCLYGNCCYKVNHQLARRLFERLYTITEDPNVACILGDLYYNATNDPDHPFYTFAYQYYSIAALGGDGDSLIKMAKMMAKGEGTMRNELVGKMTILSIYETSFTKFCNREPRNDLVEAALALAEFNDQAISSRIELNEALKYLNVARCALEYRINNNLTSVEESPYDFINMRIAYIRTIVGSNPNAKQILSEVPNMLMDALSNDYSVQVDVVRGKDENKLVTRRVCKSEEDKPMSIFIDYPLSEYAALLDVVEDYFPSKSNVWIKSGEESFITDEIVYKGHMNVCEFKHKGHVVARIKANMYTIKFR